MAKMTLDVLVTQLLAAYGAQLAAVVLYGSAATGEHNPKSSDYNVLVLLHRVDAASLAAASSIARGWHDAGNPPPMTMTTSEWRRSSDVFPMEYSDILERHKVLHGALPLDGIAVAPDHLRLQLEQQVMGKLLRLRQGSLLAGSEGKRQVELIGSSLSTVMVLFRAVLRLHGEQPTGDNATIAARVGALTGMDPAPFVRAIRHARGESKLGTDEAGAVLAQYVAGVERLNGHLDAFASP